MRTTGLSTKAMQNCKNVTFEAILNVFHLKPWAAVSTVVLVSAFGR